MGQKEHSVAIVVPAYKEHLSRTDEIALRQLQKVLGHYPKIFMAPRSLTLDYGDFGEGFQVERFDDAFFRSQTGYSVLLLRPEFYERFLAYEYILIYQTDAFVFSDRLQEFCSMGFDYIGAPIGRFVPLWHAIGVRVGNGGFSLRRTAACLQMVKVHEAWLKKSHPMMEAFMTCEDAFFGACGVWDGAFHAADLQTALAFAVQDDLQHVFRRMKAGWRPFGCHGWTAGADQDVWRQMITAEGYDLQGVTLPDKLPYGRTHSLIMWRTHRELPLHRLYALLRRNQATEALHLMACCLERYPEHAAVWQEKVEDFSYLWRMSQIFVHDEIMQQLLQSAFEEGICRSFLAGGFLPWHVGMIEALVGFHIGDAAGHERLRKTLLAARKTLDESNAPASVRPARRNSERKIVAISMVKNEMDIIESFVRHTLTFADALIIADHQSTDRTRDILGRLQEEGLPLRIEDVTDAHYAQAEVMTHLLWEAADEEAADIVLPLDADEFLVPTGGKAVRTILEQLPTDDVRAFAWRRYAPQRMEGMPAGEFPLAMQLYRSPVPEYGQKVAVGGELVRREHVRLNQGSHEVIRKTATSLRSEHGALCDGLEIVHFFWRSPAQIRSKYAVGWPNIAAKYTVNTPSGGTYRAPFQRIQKGEAPSKNEGVSAWEACDLRGRVVLPALRYSADTVPDAFQNLMTASEALAEELAETRALAEKPLVTTLLPYLGDDDAFEMSLSSALAEDYPYHEIVAFSPIETLPTVLVEALQARGVHCAGRPEEILSMTEGRYVEWLLPGAQVQAKKLRRMAACMELQDLPYPMLLSDAGGTYADVTPYIDIGVTPEKNFDMLSCQAVWQRLLVIGKYPSRGLSGLLVRREVFSACRGLMDDFAGGRPHIFAMWKKLLLAAGQQPCPYLGVMQETLAGPVQACSMEELALHQMDWQEICREEGAAISEADRAGIVDRQRRNGIFLLEHAMKYGADMQQGVWAAYQQMLAVL